MQRFLLAVRMIAEGFLALFVLLSLPLSLIHVMAERGNLAYLVGELVGMAIMLFLGIWLVKDAGRLMSRLKSSPPSSVA
jgi:hypothetical protein